MINGRRTVGLFLGGVTGNLQRRFCKALYNSSKEYGYDIFFFNFVGLIGADYTEYATSEDKMLDIIPFDGLDGIVFDNSAMLLPDIRDKIRRRLLECKCPVIAIGEPSEEFVQIHFDNVGGIAEMVRHFAVHHKFDRIGFMSGPENDPNAQARLAAFRDAMTELGLPEDGVGVFYGDFWYNKGKEAAEFFFEKCEQRPQAIVCANDYMAIAVCDALAEKGINCPEDVCISGFDDVEVARTHIPPITSVSRDEKRVAKAAFEIFEDFYKGRQITDENGKKLHLIVPTDNRYTVSCGCEQPELEKDEQDKNAASHKVLSMLYNILDTEAAMLEMNRVSEIELMTDTFAKYSTNFGSYSRFFVLAYTDEKGRRSYETEFDRPTKTVYPAVWIDHTGKSVRPDGCISTEQFVPTDRSDEPYCYYISHLHFGDHVFGYSAIMMNSDEPFNEFYNLWTVNIAISLEALLQRNIVRSLVADLEVESTHDRLTGLLNRRGFEKESMRVFREISADPEANFTAVMIDMDRLKYINDVFGHREGDFAIESVGNAISSCCGRNDISGRTGGDEFYIVMPYKDESCAENAVAEIRSKLDEINRCGGKEYDISVSCGIYSAKIKDHSGLEEFLRESDERMYIEKRSKHAQREN